MNDFVFFLLDANGVTPTPGGGGGGGLSMLIPFILIIAIFYFLIIRPQSKKQKETQRMLSTLKKGDKIVTIGGVHGTIHSVDEHSIILKVDDNTRIKFSRSAVSSIVSPSATKEKEEKAENKVEEKEAGNAESGDDAADDGNGTGGEEEK